MTPAQRGPLTAAVSVGVRPGTCATDLFSAVATVSRDVTDARRSAT